MPVIEVHGLTKRFGSVLAVDQLSFQVQAGTVTGFLGPNGAGKTTPSACCWAWCSRPRAAPPSMAGPTDSSPTPPTTWGGAGSRRGPSRRTARNHLRVRATAGQIDPARVAEVLDLVGLAAAADRRVGGFSLGMTKPLTAVHVAALVAIAGSSLAEGLYGAEFVPIVSQMIVGLAAAAIVLWRRTPTIGVIVAGWLALGPFAMPYVSDNLNSGNAGLVASTVAYLVAIVVVLASGALVLVGNRRSAPGQAGRGRPWAEDCTAIVLRTLINPRTGAIAADPTTSLPERIGGQRNWDCRFNEAARRRPCPARPAAAGLHQ